MGWSTRERIVVRGLDLPNDILGHLDLGEMAWLELTGRRPTPGEAAVFNAVVVTLVEHGLTPSAIAARLTLLGAPEAMQSAVASGLNGMGSVFAGGSEGVARLLIEAQAAHPTSAHEAVAAQIVEDHRVRRTALPGLGHHLHKPIDPRTPRLFEIAAEHGFKGRHVALLEAVQREAERVHQRTLPINATGAIGALTCELGLPWQASRGLAVIGRAIGLVGHLVEELRTPIGKEIWLRAEEESSRAAGAA
ncbi:citryl-CoA lyase [Aquabacterium sp. J223]|nr:citryl-CoA lyase [Aquabacterium sp. J223]